MLGLEECVVLLAAAVAFLGAVLATKHKSLLYAAISLALLGTANAVLFAMLGQLLVALFQVIIYVGATVIFIIITIAMFKEVPELPRPLLSASAAIVLALGAVMAFALMTAVPARATAAAPQAAVVETLLSKQQLTILAICLTLLATLIGGVVIARRDLR